jgi:methyl-accepting chemotaxis protein
MSKQEKKSFLRKFRQNYFVARELQFSIALLVVLALLGGIFLQTVSTSLTKYYGYNTPALGMFLILGYIVLVVILSVLFTHRLVGPFKRLEYEMKLVSSGELSRRLTIRSKDDLHVRNFVRYSNDFIGNFEEMSNDYNKLNSTISVKLNEISREMAKGEVNCVFIQDEIKALNKQIHQLREKW